MDLYNERHEKVGSVEANGNHDNPAGCAIGCIVIILVFAWVTISSAISSLYSFLETWPDHAPPYNVIMAFYYFLATIPRLWFLAFPVIWQTAFTAISTPFPNLNLILDWCLALLAVTIFAVVTVGSVLFAFKFIFKRWKKTSTVCLITTLVGPGLIAILWSAIEWLFAPS